MLPGAVRLNNYGTVHKINTDYTVKWTSAMLRNIALGFLTLRKSEPSDIN